MILLISDLLSVQLSKNSWEFVKSVWNWDSTVSQWWQPLWVHARFPADAVQQHSLCSGPVAACTSCANSPGEMSQTQNHSANLTGSPALGIVCHTSLNQVFYKENGGLVNGNKLKILLAVFPGWWRNPSTQQKSSEAASCCFSSAMAV